MKVPPRQSEREKIGVRRHAGRVKTDVPRRDSDLDSEHQANLKRDVERAEADKAKLQSRKDSDISQSAIPARGSPQRRLKPSSSVSHKYTTKIVAV
jgi:hypothetical protein